MVASPAVLDIHLEMDEELTWMQVWMNSDCTWWHFVGLEDMQYAKPKEIQSNVVSQRFLRKVSIGK